MTFTQLRQRKRRKKLLWILLPLISILSITILTFSLTSCNMQIGWGNLNFKKIHLYENNRCYSIKSWHDSEGPGIEVKTEYYGTWFVSEGTYMLVEDTCPYCGA